MPTIRVNDIEIDYAERGERDAAAIVLIRGLGTQRIQWPESLLAGLVEHGLRVMVGRTIRHYGVLEKLSSASVRSRVECPSAPSCAARSERESVKTAIGRSTPTLASTCPPPYVCVA